MYVCICRGFNDRQVRDAARDCRSVSEIFRVLGDRPSCGKCVGAVRDIARKNDSTVCLDVPRSAAPMACATEPEPVAG